MGDKVEPRRKWIEANVAFTLAEEGNTLLEEATGDEDSITDADDDFVAPIIETWQD